MGDEEKPVETTAPTVRRKYQRKYPKPGTEAPPPVEAASTPSAPPKPDMRPEMRVDSRAEAEKRAAQILDNNPDFGSETDKYEMDMRLVPDGWVYSWKRRTVLGQEDPSYQTQLMRAGWTPVPAARHRDMMPDRGHFEIIERDGLVLMERPHSIDERARMQERRKAMEQVRGKEAQLGNAPPGQFARTENPAAAPKINKNYAAIPIP
jgi:hypothetical protein